MMRSRKTVNIVALAAVCTYFLVPIWWLIVASTKSQGELNNSPGLWFGEFDLFENIDRLLTRNDGIFVRWMGNSLLYAGVGAAVGTVLSTCAGYALSKLDFRGSGVVFKVILAGVLVPPAALALPTFLMLSEVGGTNTYWSVLVPGFVSPLSVYLARVAADAAIPDELLEAAAIDGAGPIRSFFSVGFPLMGPALVTIFLFQLVAIWNNFLLPLMMLNDNRKYPVTLGLFNWTGQYIQDGTLVTSVIVGSFLSILPVAIAFIALQRFWVIGGIDGAVKG